MSWAEIAKALEEFKPPEVTRGDEGVVFNPRWVFRGLKSVSYKLEPTIEREAQSKSIEWGGLEHFASNEFKSRARIHLSALWVPDDELSWLALMQHYAVPTRLLDFTYSPFVAFYFAVSPGSEKKYVRNSVRNRSDVRMWAIDSEAAKREFSEVARRARGMRGCRVGISPADQETDRDGMIREIGRVPGAHCRIAVISPQVQKCVASARVRLPRLTACFQPAVREPARSVFA